MSTGKKGQTPGIIPRDSSTKNFSSCFSALFPKSPLERDLLHLTPLPTVWCSTINEFLYQLSCLLPGSSAALWFFFPTGLFIQWKSIWRSFTVILCTFRFWRMDIISPLQDWSLTKKHLAGKRQKTDRQMNKIQRKRKMCMLVYPILK